MNRGVKVVDIPDFAEAEKRFVLSRSYPVVLPEVLPEVGDKVSWYNRPHGLVLYRGKVKRVYANRQGSVRVQVKANKSRRPERYTGHKTLRLGEVIL